MAEKHNIADRTLFIGRNEHPTLSANVDDECRKACSRRSLSCKGALTGMATALLIHTACGGGSSSLQRKTTERLPSDGAEERGERWGRLKSGSANKVRRELKWAVKRHTDPGPSLRVAEVYHQDGVDQRQREGDGVGRTPGQHEKERTVREIVFPYGPIPSPNNSYFLAALQNAR